MEVLQTSALPLGYGTERAGNRARTGDLNLGKVALYQLSYARKKNTRHDHNPLAQSPRGTDQFKIQNSTFKISKRSHGESNPGLHLERVAS